MKKALSQTGLRPQAGDRDRKHIEINIGLGCNCRCMFCLTEGPRTFVPFAQIKAEALEYAQRGYNSVGFIGGEPTVHPDILELGKACSEFGYKKIHVVSNGIRFADADFLDHMLGAGFTRFSVSMHSHVAAVENELTGVKNAFDKKIQGLKNLSEQRSRGRFSDRIPINIVMNRRNLPSLEDTLLFFKELGFSEFRLLIIRPESRAFENFQDMVPAMAEVRDRIRVVLRVAQHNGLHVLMDTPPLCLFYDIPRISKIIAQDHIDEIIHSDRDLVRERFSWEHRRVTRGKVKGEKCGECIFDQVCEGVWRGYADKMGFDEFQPVRDRDLGK